MNYGPFYDNIAGTVTVAPGTGNVGITAAAPGSEAWTTIGVNVVVHYRGDEAGTWERGIGLWANATNTFVRLVVLANHLGTTAKINFGTGVIFSLVAPADEIQPHIGGGKWGMWSAIPGSATMDTFALAAPTVTGTAAAGTISSSRMGRRHRITVTSLTTANAIAGLSSTANSVQLSSSQLTGGFEFVARGGFSTIPTGPRYYIGVGAGVLSTVEPSTINNFVGFAKDSTDANIQFMSRSGTTTTKVDMGLALTANTPYEFAIWAMSPAATLVGQIIAMDGTAGNQGVITTNLPAIDTNMNPIFQGSLNGTNTGTAIVPNIESVYLRSTQ